MNVKFEANCTEMEITKPKTAGTFTQTGGHVLLLRGNREVNTDTVIDYRTVRDTNPRVPISAFRDPRDQKLHTNRQLFVHIYVRGDGYFPRHRTHHKPYFCAP